MKQNLITDVVQAMLPFLNNAQTERLQEVLQHTLFGYEVTKIESEKGISEQNYVELFLSAKRIEGCSEKSLKYYKTDGGLMIWNDKIKRKIPASWEIKSFGELCSLRNGINYDKSVEGEKMYKIINVRNISSSDLILNENDFDEISLPQKQGNKYRVSDNSIIVARSGIPGATRILQKPSGNIIFCGFIICCTPCDDIYKYSLRITKIV